MRSIAASLEWRFIAFILTGLFLWATGGDFWAAARTALVLHLILLTGHATWFYFRSGYRPLETAVTQAVDL
jgi:hypothetical protein